ncbi:MAG: hypothetical protein ACFCUG_02515 [Thiotrichales bacterium]
MPSIRPDYDASPPYSIPIRFYLLAPGWLVLAAVVALGVDPAWAANRWQPATLALTHLLTLGFLGMTMVGSFIQVVGVVGGVALPAVGPVSTLTLAGLLVGTPALAFGLLTSEPLALQLGALALGVGGFGFVTIAGIGLMRAARNPIVAYVRLAWFALALTLALGLALAGALAGWWPLAAIVTLTDLHAAWGLLGWVFLLVVGVGLEVVPMFQVTPPYPRALIRTLGWAVVAALGLLSAALPLGGAAADWLAILAEVMLAAAVAGFALTTLRLQAQRRRKLRDTTLDYWRLAMVSLLLAALLSLVRLGFPTAPDGRWQVLLGMVFLLGFAVPVVSGMLYKIVPFLGWLHLQSVPNRPRQGLPNPIDLMPDRATRQQYWVYLASVLILAPSPWLGRPCIVVGATGLGIAGLLLWLQIWRTCRRLEQYGVRVAWWPHRAA